MLPTHLVSCHNRSRVDNDLPCIYIDDVTKTQIQAVFSLLASKDNVDIKDIINFLEQSVTVNDFNLGVPIEVFVKKIQY